MDTQPDRGRNDLRAPVGGLAAGEVAGVQIVVPVYNEGEQAVVLYETLRRDGVSFDSLSFVHDHDEDTTLPFITQLRSVDPRVGADRNTRGAGILNALRHAFSRSRPGPVIVVMGDNSDKLSIIPRMVELWRAGATIVSPSRYMRGGAQLGGGFLKKSLSRLAGRFLHVVGFPTSDPTNNFKLYDGAWLREQDIESRGGFEVALELCYKAVRQGRQIVEIPTIWRDRQAGTSRFRLWKWLPHYLRWFLKSLGYQFLRRLGFSSAHR